MSCLENLSCSVGRYFWRGCFANIFGNKLSTIFNSILLIIVLWIIRFSSFSVLVWHKVFLNLFEGLVNNLNIVSKPLNLCVWVGLNFAWHTPWDCEISTEIIPNRSAAFESNSWGLCTFIFWQNNCGCWQSENGTSCNKLHFINYKSRSDLNWQSINSINN